MRNPIATSSLMPADRLARSICHPSGRILHERGSSLTAAHIEALRKHKIEQVVEVDTREEAAAIRESASQRSAWVADLQTGMPLPAALKSAGGSVLLPQGAILTKEAQALLARRGIVEAYWDRSLIEATAAQVDAYLAEIADHRLVDDFVAEGMRIAPDLFGGAKKRVAPPAATPAPSGADRRKHRRIPANIPTQFQVQRRLTSAWEAAATRGTLRDISKGGLCLVTLREMRRGDRVKVFLEPKSRTIEVEGIAEVVRVTKKDGAFEIGARFLYIGAKRRG